VSRGSRSAFGSRGAAERSGPSIANCGSCMNGTLWRIVRSMSRSSTPSSDATSDTARPVAPARAVRPMRCT
jgi:hypothetical protein